MKGLDGLGAAFIPPWCATFWQLCLESLGQRHGPASHRKWMYCDVDDGFSVWLVSLFIFARGRIWFLEFFLHIVERMAAYDAVISGVRRTFGTACFSLNDATSGRVVFLTVETRRCQASIWSGGYYVPAPGFEVDFSYKVKTCIFMQLSTHTQGPLDRFPMRGKA